MTSLTERAMLVIEFRALAWPQAHPRVAHDPQAKKRGRSPGAPQKAAYKVAYISKNPTRHKWRKS